MGNYRPESRTPSRRKCHGGGGGHCPGGGGVTTMEVTRSAVTVTITVTWVTRHHYFRHRSKYTPFRLPPFMVFWTFCSNILRLVWSSCAASLLRGSSGFGSRKRYWRPYTIELIVNTGFQSSLRILRQTFPSRSILGW